MRLCQPEVEQLGAHPCQHDVAGLQVSMGYSCAVGFVKSVCDFRPVPERLLNRKCTFGELGSKRLPVQKLHDDVVDPVLLAHIVEHANMRMPKSCDHPCFLAESLFCDRISAATVRQHFYGNCSVEPRVSCAVNLTHAAGTET